MIIATTTYFTISLLTDKIFFWEQVLPLTRNLANIRSIAFMVLEGLFIFRGIYFLRKHSFQKKYLFELLLGLFLVITSGSKLYIVKNMAENFYSGINFDMNKSNSHTTPKFTAYKVFLIEGKTIKYSGKTFKPTEQDYKDRVTYAQIQSNLKTITRGIYNTLGVLLLSVLLGLLCPLSFKRSTSTKKEILGNISLRKGV